MEKDIRQDMMNDPFWIHDIPLFSGTFRYYRNRKQPVRGKVHAAKERHDASDSLERDYLTVPRGERFYVLMQPYVIEPRIVMSVALDDKPKQYADQGEAIGQTTDSRVEGYSETKVGNAQAWYYPEDRMLVLWECFLESFVRDSKLNEDEHMRLLWTRFEKWLLTQYPQTSRIVTPWADPLWEQKEYQTFLKSLGFQKGKPGLFTKLVK
jgi:hypothetical protein